MGKTILYVEDEDSDVYLLNHAFQEIGLQNPFTLVTDGEQAIRYLSAQEPYTDRDRYPWPCLIMLDLNVPRINGFEVLQWRRQHGPARKIPVVVFTSSSSQQDIERAYELGAAAYLIKQPNPEEWSRCVGAIRDFWLEQNTIPTPNPEPVSRRGSPP